MTVKLLKKGVKEELVRLYKERGRIDGLIVIKRSELFEAQKNERPD